MQGQSTNVYPLPLHESAVSLGQPFLSRFGPHGAFLDILPFPNIPDQCSIYLCKTDQHSLSRNCYGARKKKYIERERAKSAERGQSVSRSSSKGQPRPQEDTQTQRSPSVQQSQPAAPWLRLARNSWPSQLSNQPWTVPGVSGT